MQIRFAKSEDEPRIIDFLKRHWTGNRILVDSPVIFEYQYMRQSECGFVLAENDDGEICGIKGFIPENSSETPDVAAALAIALNSERPMLNMEMQRFLEKNTHSRMMCSTGLNPNTAARIYPLFRYKVDKLRQYYRLSDTTDFRIAGIRSLKRRPVADGGFCLRYLATMEELLGCFSPDDYKENRPYKDAGYISYRYFEHPVYEYRVYGVISENGAASSLLVTREIPCLGSKAVRIVDFIGRRADFASLGGAIERLLSERGGEYIDFYCYGMRHEDMEAAGFELRSEDDVNIIPNYFEPFIQKNVEIVFFCNLHEDFLICKADGDQDRPSIMPAEKNTEGI